MTVLSQTVIDAGARVGRIVKYYETVAELLAATDSIADGEFVQAAQYFYEGAGSGASDHNVTNAGGSKLYCVGNPFVTPDQFGAPSGTSDSTTYVQAAIASGKPVFLNREYRVTNVYFPAGQQSVMIMGAGAGIGVLRGTSSTAEAVLQTFESGDNTETNSHYLSNFSITGVGKRGLAVCQVSNSLFENIKLSGFNAAAPAGETIAILVEQSFSNVFRNIQTGVGNRIDLAIYQTVLDTIFDMFYTNNVSACVHIDIDNAKKEMAVKNSPGNALVTFNNATLQGCNGYAVRMRGQSSVNFRDTYVENCEGILLVTDGDCVNFYGGELNSNNAGHGLWLDQIQGAETGVINFFGTTILDPIVVGKISQLGLYGCNLDVETKVKKTNASYKLKEAMSTSGSTAMQLVSMGEYQASAGSTITLKCSDGSQMSKISVASTGTVSGATPFSLTDVAEEPLMPVPWWPASFSPAWTNGVAISSQTVGCVGGTAPYTFSIIGDVDTPGVLPTGVTLNTGTGEISGTPTQTGTFPFKVKVTDSSSPTFFADTGWITATVT